MRLLLPDVPSVETETDKLADWCEVAALFLEEGEVARGDLEDVVFDPGLLGSTVAKGGEASSFHDDSCLSSQDALARMSGDVWQILKRRAKDIGDGYPFVMDGNIFVRKEAIGSWKDIPAAASLVLANACYIYDKKKVKNPGATPYKSLFETVVMASMEGLFGGTAVRFGTPVDQDWPEKVTSIDDRLLELGNRIQIKAKPSPEELDPRDKDIGLDVLARFKMGARQGGLVYILTQCATGEDWEGKTGEPSLDVWGGLMTWDAIRVTALAVPFRISEEKKMRRTARDFSSLILDRCRLLRGKPDERLPAWCARDLVMWCGKQLTGMMAAA